MIVAFEDREGDLLGVFEMSIIPRVGEDVYMDVSDGFLDSRVSAVCWHLGVRREEDTPPRDVTVILE